MNNFHNNFDKFVSPPTVLANPTGIYRTEPKKSQQETRNLQKIIEPKTSEALKIFYESKTFKPEPHHEWNVERERSRVLPAKGSVDVKKSKKIHTKPKDGCDPKLKKLYIPANGSRTSKTFCDRQESQKTLLWTLGKNQESMEKQKTDSEAQRRSSFSTIKTGLDKHETKGKAHSISNTQSITRKISEKSTKLSDMKTVISDVGKKHINEILKNHAQKTQSCVIKTLVLKDLPHTEDHQHQRTSITQMEKIAEKSEAKRFVKEKETAEVKKKILDVVLNVPQSTELGRRLNNIQKKGSEVLKYDQVEDSTDDEQNSTCSNKIDQRATYTDQLPTPKPISEKKKSEVEAKDSKEVKKAKSENSETALRKLKPYAIPLIKEITQSEKEFEIKQKVTSSTELKDLVSQAIRDHKIFCIFDNHTYIVRPVREELLNRGWLEVIPDRRLIPRRRPPPTGPTYERDKNSAEQNCTSLQAILAAKEVFVDELEETFSKSSFKLLIDRTKMQATMTKTSRSKSEESVSDTVSQFHIMPPTAEKKKNNIDIRQFAVKYGVSNAKEKDRKYELNLLKEMELNNIKKKEMSQEKLKISSSKEDLESKPLLKDSLSFQSIANLIQTNKKILLESKLLFKDTEISSTSGSEAKDLPMLEEKPNQKSKPRGSSSKSVYTDSEAKAISKLIQSSNSRIHFMWLSIKPGIHLKCFNYSPEIVNKFQKTTFCTKIGLWSHLNNMQWYAHEVHHPAKSPRMYNTGEPDDLQAFYQDFHLTACIGILKWLCDTLFEKGLKAVQTKRGKVPLKAFEFAIKQCERYIRFKENEELNLLQEPKLNQEEWNNFLHYFYIITNDNGKIQDGSSAQVMVTYTKGVETLKAMKRHWPEIDIDGRLNIWIMKPYCASCGRGIFMTNNVYYISQHSKYIVQKYIEKPLLIYNTKFDIRQWFMITKLTPLEIWMYKECYLRFCSQPFTLRNLHESVHLSNNSVQRKYINVRDTFLPNQNMWDSKTFQLYLNTIGFPNVWEDVIYPGMKDAIVSTMLASQDTFDSPRKNWFEVYGADFMLSSNIKEGPWLIEINENPAMDPSTTVTSRLCPQMLRDVIKVVVDKRANKNASTGQWEMIYRQNYTPSFGTVDLDVRGKKLARIQYSASDSHCRSGGGRFVKKDSLPKEIGNNKLYEYVRDLKHLN